MRMIAFCMLICCVHVSAKTSSQTISFSGNNVPLEKLFSAIKKQSGFVVMYNKGLLRNTTPVSINAREMPLEEFLNQALRGQPLSYRIAVETIFLSEKPVVKEPRAFDAPASVSVSGTIRSASSQPVSGASVSVKGTDIGTTTNENGSFLLNDIDENSVLQVSSVGYEAMEIPLNRLRSGSSGVANVRLLTAARAGVINIGISLQQSVDSLENIVVNSYGTGYQTISKERATGSFSTITASELKQQRLSDLGTLLEGRIAGYNNGLVRGTTSMNGMTNPLYVVDGFPIENTRYDEVGSLVENLPGLNLEDIEKITVLKDAAAASIYGARAANGVVVIVTKKGSSRKGSAQVSVSSNLTFSPKYIYTGRLTNSADIIGLEKEWAAANPNFQGGAAQGYAESMLENPMYTTQGATAYLNYYAGRITQAELDQTLGNLEKNGYAFYDDVKKYARRNAFYQQYNVNIGTSTEKNSFYASVTYRDNKAEKIKADDRSIGINLKNITSVNKWLSLELGTYLQYADVNTPTYDPLSPGYTYAPYDRLVTPNGDPFTLPASSRLSLNNLNIIDQYGLYSMDITPLDEVKRNIGQSRNFMNRSMARLNITFNKWLSYQTSFQYEYGNDRYNVLYDKNSYYVRNRVNSFAGYTADEGFFYLLPYGNIYNTNNQLNTAYNFRQQLNFDKRFDGGHNVTAILGTETRHSKLEQAEQTLYNYDPNVLSYDLIDAKKMANAYGTFFGGYFSAYDVAVNREIVNRFVSAYGNAAYSYNDKYLFTGSLRWDRSNLWGTDSKYQNKPLWSLGAGWNIYREGFFQSAFFTMLKLRGSYGIGGNIAKNSAPYMTAYYSPNYTVGGIQGSISSRPNPLLSWEKTITSNLGIDFGILKNRVTGAVDYYHKRGEDLLANTMGVPTEGFGYSTYAINNGRMTNAGVELTVSADIVKSKNVNWNLTAIFARNKNKVTYVNVEAPVYFLQLDYPEAYPRIGNPFNAIYGYEWAGLTDQGIPQVYDDTKTATDFTPQTLESIVYAGTTIPVYNGSFSNTLQFRNFVLSFLLTYEGGHKIRNTDLPMLPSEFSYVTYSYYTPFSALNKGIADRWRQPGDEAVTDVPRAVFAEDPAYNQNSYEVYGRSTINVLNASNIRLRNISLGYNIPSSFAGRFGMAGARTQFNAENLLMVAKDKTAKYLLGGFIAPRFVWSVFLNF